MFTRASHPPRGDIGVHSVSGGSHVANLSPAIFFTCSDFPMSELLERIVFCGCSSTSCIANTAINAVFIPRFGQRIHWPSASIVSRRPLAEGGMFWARHPSEFPYEEGASCPSKRSLRASEFQAEGQGCCPDSAGSRCRWR